MTHSYAAVMIFPTGPDSTGKHGKEEEGAFVVPGVTYFSTGKLNFAESETRDSSATVLHHSPRLEINIFLLLRHGCIEAISANMIPLLAYGATERLRQNLHDLRLLGSKLEEDDWKFEAPRHRGT
jgi:hypothetical protein